MLIVSSLLFLAVFNIGEVKCDIFTNPFSLRELFLAEGRLVEAMREYGLQLEESELKNKIDRYLSDHQLILDELPPLPPLSSTDPDNYEDPLMTEVVGNPIHVFRLCMRVTKELTDIVNMTEAVTEEEEEDIPEKKDFLDAVEVEKTDTAWCLEEDLAGASLSLARIQTFYMLDPVDMARGVIGDKVTKARLGVSDCVFLGEDRLTGVARVAHGGPEIALAIEWMEAAYQLSVEQNQDHKLMQTVKKRLLELRKLHDDGYQPMQPGNGPSFHPSEYYFLRKIGQDLNLTARQLRIEEDKLFVEERFSIQTEGFNYNTRDFAYLCRGLKLRRPGTTVKFGNQCFLSDKGDPYLKLMPIKVEVLTEVPMMHVYHDVVSDRDADFIKRQARTQFQQAAIEDISKAPGAKMVSHSRTQSVGWLVDHGTQSAQLEIVAKKLSRATGLEVARNTHFSTKVDTMVTFESEQLQVGIYGPGGLYLPHIDTLDNDPALFAHGSIWVGNRMSTAMIYLSDKLGGGGTAFPQVGVAAFPKKGSVVFWHSLTMDGRKDPISMHGACPTMYGIKWVANKWIREGCQMFKRPCGMTKNEGVISSILLN